MTSAFTRLFSKKKAADEGSIDKAEYSKYGTKKPIQTLAIDETEFRDAATLHLGYTRGTGWPRGKSPYSSVPEPKTTKSAKSCPIGDYTYYRPGSSNGGAVPHIDLLQHRAPAHHALHPQRLISGGGKFSTIPESSECYANYPPVDNATTKDRHHKTSNFRTGGGGSLVDYGTKRSWGGGGSLVDYGPKRSWGREAHRNHAFGRCSIREEKAQRSSKNIVTSEYGSADPSPTDLLSRPNHTRADIKLYHTTTFDNDNSDEYDSCDSDEVPSDLIQLCTQQLRRANGKCRLYKQMAKGYKAKNKRLVEELNATSKLLLKEQKKNCTLLAQLSTVNQELFELRLQPEKQFHQHEKFPPTVQSLSAGAGESLCCREDAVAEVETLPSTSTLFTQDGHSKLYVGSSLDELLHLRGAASAEFNESFNESSRRDAVGYRTIGSPYKLSPIRPEDNAVMRQIVSDDEGLSNRKGGLLAEERVPTLDAQLRGERSGFEMDLKPLHVSLSDSALLDLCRVGTDGLTQPNNDLETLDSFKSRKEKQSAATREVSPGETSRKWRCKKNRHRSGLGERLSQSECSSYSSDDDAMRLLMRQLKCGRRDGLGSREVVRFRPPRKCVEARTYSRFGVDERKVMAQFDYLREMQTDVSGLASSPDSKVS